MYVFNEHLESTRGPKAKRSQALSSTQQFHVLVMKNGCFPFGQVKVHTVAFLSGGSNVTEGGRRESLGLLLLLSALAQGSE